MASWSGARLVQATMPYAWHLLTALVGMWVVAAAEPAVVWAVKYVVDQGLDASKTPQWLSWLPAALGLIYLFKGLAGYIAGYLMMWVSGKVMLRLQMDVYRAILTADPKTDQQHIGQAINVVAAEARQALDFIERVLIRTLRSLFRVVALAITLFQINPAIALLLLTMVAPFIWVVRWLGSRYETATGAYVGANATLAAASEETLRNVELVRQFDAARFESARLDLVSRTVHACFRNMATRAGSILPLSQMVVAVYLALFYWLRPQFGNLLTQGEFVAMSATMLLLLSPLSDLATLNAAMVRSLVAAGAVFSLVDLPRERSGGIRLNGNQAPRIELCAVAIGAAGIKDVNLTVNAGEIVALTGTCGSGKSSILRMVCGLDVPAEGTIRIDGVCLSQIALDDLRAQIAYVGHDGGHVGGTILQNVCYGNGTPDLQRVALALRSAQLEAFVGGLPDGVLTHVGLHALQLSGGQSQLLAVARALYRNAPIVLLDEPSSALDRDTQAALAEALKALLVGRTALVVSHSAMMLTVADRIVHLEEGRAMELFAVPGLMCQTGAVIEARLSRVAL